MVNMSVYKRFSGICLFEVSFRIVVRKEWCFAEKMMFCCYRWSGAAELAVSWC